jgi:DNA-directed RNA polymerase specialized sigma24 family protein
MDDMASPPGSDTIERAPLDLVVARCRTERHTYRKSSADESPWCVEVFRRAFARDQDAWEAIQLLVVPLMRAWVGSQQQIEIEDVIQDALSNFAQRAPGIPNLVAGSSLGPVLAYLKRCTITAVLEMARKAQRQAQTVYLYDVPDLQGQGDIAAGADLRLDLLGRIQNLLESDQERLVFQGRFVCHLKPSQILEYYPQAFDDIASIYNVVQRLTRRLSADPEIRELRSLAATTRRNADQLASLEKNTQTEMEQGNTMGEPCELDEATLLDYISGVASIEIRRAVERSPACLAAAERLAATILPLMRALYRASCPEAATLIAYHERRLEGTAALLVRQHLAICHLCQEEMGTIAALDTTPTERPWLGRRIIEAIMVSALDLPQPVRGRVLHFQTPQVAINLSLRKTEGMPRTWTLRGQIRTPEGLVLSGQIEAATLRPLGPPEQPEAAGTIDADGSFVFERLPAGAYTLTIITPDEEIMIRRLLVGDI